MIRVRVHINSNQIIDVHAVRQEEFLGMSKRHRYKVYITQIGEDAEHIFLGELKHKYSLGASRLSVRMLQLYYKTKGQDDILHSGYTFRT